MNRKLLLFAPLSIPRKMTIGVSNPNGFDTFSTLDDLKNKWHTTNGIHIVCIVGNNYDFVAAIALTEIDEINFAADKTYYTYSGAKTMAYTERPLLIKGFGRNTASSYTNLGTGAIYCNGRPVTFESIRILASVYGGARGNVPSSYIAYKNIDSNKTGLYYSSVASAETSNITGDVVGYFEDPPLTAKSVYGPYISGAGTVNVGGALKCVLNGGSYNQVLFAGQLANNNGAKNLQLHDVDVEMVAGDFTNYVCTGPLCYATATVNCDDIHWKIRNGTFAAMVAVGLYGAGGYSTVNGDILLEVDGGTFNGILLGGCWGTNDANSEKTLVKGDITMRLNGGTFNGDVICGGYLKDAVEGNTLMVIGENAVFGNDAWISGDSRSSTVGTSYVSGTKTLKVNSNRNLLCTVGPTAFNEIEIGKGYHPSFANNVNLEYTELQVHNGDSAQFNGAGTELKALAMIDDGTTPNGTLAAFSNAFTLTDGFAVYVIHNGTRIEAVRNGNQFITDDWIIELVDNNTSIIFRGNA